jgi:hypothetical protein
MEERRAVVDGRIAELRALVEREVVPLIDWYQRKKRWPRRLHRLSGIAVIGLGATIPVLSAYTDAQPARVLVGTAGAVITVITGLATVYEWQKTWRIFTVAQTELEAHRLRRAPPWRHARTLRAALGAAARERHCRPSRLGRAGRRRPPGWQWRARTAAAPPVRSRRP